MLNLQYYLYNSIVHVGILLVQIPTQITVGVNILFHHVQYLEPRAPRKDQILHDAAAVETG